MSLVWSVEASPETRKDLKELDPQVIWDDEKLVIFALKVTHRSKVYGDH